MGHGPYHKGCIVLEAFLDTALMYHGLPGDLSTVVRVRVVPTGLLGVSKGKDSGPVSL